MPPIPPYVKIDGARVAVTPVFYSYWKFAAERQKIFFRRLAGANALSLTDDAILQSYKFTNTYRASDRVSQFLIRNVIYGDGYSDQPEEIFFRTLLFKLFNKIETWRLLEQKLGRISLSAYDYDAFDAVLSSAMKCGTKIYSAAYIMPSAGGVFGKTFKHQNHLKLIEMMLGDRFPERVGQARSMAEVFDLMASAPSIGPFLAYQLATDLNYGPVTAFSEMDFVVAGPGALDGISKCFVDGHKLDPRLVITYMAGHQAEWFDRLDIPFPDLWGRSLQLIDCQNLFCEISKYSRAAFPTVQGISGRTRIKQKFSPKGRPPAPWYPPKWGINDRIEVPPHSTRGWETARAVQYTLF